MTSIRNGGDLDKPFEKFSELQGKRKAQGMSEEEDSEELRDFPCSMEISNDNNNILPSCDELPRLYYTQCTSQESGRSPEETRAMATTVSVNFDYELHYSALSPPVEIMEVVLLDHLSHVLKLRNEDCDRRRMEETRSSDSQEHLVFDGSAARRISRRPPA